MRTSYDRDNDDAGYGYGYGAGWWGGCWEPHRHRYRDSWDRGYWHRDGCCGAHGERRVGEEEGVGDEGVGGKEEKIVFSGIGRSPPYLSEGAG